jgi:tetratricopeptide (TPR) repeat protein
MSADTASSSELYQRAVAAYDSGELAEAERLCAKIHQDEAEHFDAARLLARVQCRLGRYHEALASFDAALAIRPDDAEALNRRGDVLRQLNRLEEALASCEAALAISPGMAAAYNSRGLILEDLRRLPEALESFCKAQELTPAYAEAHWNEATLRLLTGEFLRGWTKYDGGGNATAWRRGGANSPNRSGTVSPRSTIRPS